MDLNVASLLLIELRAIGSTRRCVDAGESPIPETERSKARVCGHSLAGIADSNSFFGV